MESKYLFIFEDGPFIQSSSYSGEDILSVSSGVLDIVTFQNGRFEQMDLEGIFQPINNWWFRPDRGTGVGYYVMYFKFRIG